MSDVVYLKTVILGDIGVGKTSLVTSFVSNSFNDEYHPTIGVEFTTKRATINGTKVVFQIWDFSGHNKSPRLVSEFSRDVDCCIFVYDVTNSESFQSLDFLFSEFLDLVHVNADTFPFALVGNKIDLRDDSENLEDASDWCDQRHCMPYFEISNKDGGLKVEEIFRAVATKRLKNLWRSMRNTSY